MTTIQEVLGTNTDVFASAFEAVDRRLFAIMRFLSELRRAVPTYGTEDGDVDWDQYFTEYEAALAFIKLGRTMTPATEAAVDDSVVIFGGDVKGPTNEEHSTYGQARPREDDDQRDSSPVRGDEGRHAQDPLP